jgi:hypothetical protein
MQRSTADLALEVLIEKAREESYVPEYRDRVSDAEVFGLLVARFFHWDGNAILECAGSALEDANFHSEACVVREMIDRA